MSLSKKRDPLRMSIFLFLTRGLCLVVIAGLFVILSLGPPASAQEPLWPLTMVEKLGTGMLKGPEDVAVDSEGNAFAGCADGGIYRVAPDGTVTVFTNTGGRPLGLYFGKQGNLLVCDAKRRAVLSITPAGLISSLTDSSAGTPLYFPDDLWAARDGTIYFSDATTYPFGEEMRDLVRGEPLGRVLAIRPDGAVEILKGELYFPNGVTLSPDESVLYVAETSKRRILRMGLQGDQRGKTEVFVDELPGFIDGIALDPEGNILVAVPSVSEKNRKLVESFPGFFRSAMSHLPMSLMPTPAREGMVLRVRPDRRVEVLLTDPKGEVISSVTNVIEAGGYLYLGFLYYGDGIARIRKP
jgi:sugar lactone lactonase YvrE